jgi:hypothetical protein
MTVPPYPTLGSAWELFFPLCYGSGLHIDKRWPCVRRSWVAQYVDSTLIVLKASHPSSVTSSRKSA